MILALLLVPFFSGLVCFLVRNDSFRRGLWAMGASVHLILTCLTWTYQPAHDFSGWFEIDGLAKLFLTITSLLFCAASIYGVRYLNQEKRLEKNTREEGFIFHNAPEAVFTGCMLLFLSTMTMVLVSQHLGILWVAMEATTLMSAPLIYFHRHHRSLEATWKYLLICSVGIAMALLGNLFLAVASSERQATLLVKDLVLNGVWLNIPWLKAAFLFLFVGYGTKMGLVPLHTWLPDAHSEAPSVVSALLSGALLNCAFVGILRTYQVCVAAGLTHFCQELFVLFGLLSMALAALFILGQTDYKRMLAYSSIEHMGILSLGIGLGGGAVFGVMFHALNHSLVKAGLFFVAGNILALYRTKSIPEVKGLLKVLPVSGFLWFVGFLAISGTPPFGVFLSKFIILRAAFDQGHYVQGSIFLILLAVIFIGMARIFIPMTQADPVESLVSLRKKESLCAIFPTVILFLIVFILGLYLPPVLQDVLKQAAQSLEGF